MNLTGNQYSWTASIFYIGYLVAQIPANWLLGRFKAGRVLGISCVIWGGMVLAMLGCKNYASAMVVRFLLGVFEAAVTRKLYRVNVTETSTLTTLAQLEQLDSPS